MLNEELFTRKMLGTIRENKCVLTEEAQATNGKAFQIKKDTPQFGDVRVSQEETLVKTIGESIDTDDNALVYYPNNKDLVFTFKINSLNVAAQFRHNDPSGQGCYLWCNGLQLTDANNRTLHKIYDAYVNWKQNLVENSDLLEKLFKAATTNKV